MLRQREILGLEGRRKNSKEVGPNNEGISDHTYGREVLQGFSEPSDFTNSTFRKSKPLLHSTPHFNKVLQKTTTPVMKTFSTPRSNPYAHSSSNVNNEKNKQSGGRFKLLPSGSKSLDQNDKSHSSNPKLVQTPKDFRDRSQGYSQQTPLRGRERNQENFLMGSARSNKFSETESVRKNLGHIASKLLHLTGSVDHVVHWHKQIKNQDGFISFEVSGVLESMLTKGLRQLIFLRADSGHILQGIFYAIDRKLPDFQIGAIVTATGRMVGRNKLHVLDAVETTKEEQRAAERLWFLCQRTFEALS